MPTFSNIIQDVYMLQKFKTKCPNVNV